MNISTVIGIVAISTIYRISFRKRSLKWFIFVFSIFSVFYFQPVSTIRHLDFWVSSSIILFSILIWDMVRNRTEEQSPENKISFLIVAIFFLTIGLTRFIPAIPTSKYISVPQFYNVIIFLALGLFGGIIINKYAKWEGMVVLSWGLILFLFLVLKQPYFAQKASVILRSLNRQSIQLASSSEILIIGYSYIAFRLLHVLIEYKKRGPLSIDMGTFIGYVFFYPTLLAGPIMKYNQYISELKRESSPKEEDMLYAVKRISLGLFQKYILADSITAIALNESLVQQVSDSRWLWLFTVLYTLRIFLDFSGYSHLAIGISSILGIKVPENFRKPFQSPTLTIFWNNWHITLTQWFRSYYFNPLSRYLKKHFRKINQNIILFFMQTSTMVLIGLWHGITWNFVLWGLWIGIGLFIQNQITSWLTKSAGDGKQLWQKSKLVQIMSILVTFTYVTLGWVWFALPGVHLSWKAFGMLFGKS